MKTAALLKTLDLARWRPERPSGYSARATWIRWKHKRGQIIAAAIIVRGAVGVPSIPSGRQRIPDGSGVRLRELTDYVDRLVTTDEPDEPR